MQAQTMLAFEGVSKTFTMHLRGGTKLPVFENVDLEVTKGECVALAGPSGVGKSSILKMAYANYRCEAGDIRIRHGGNIVNLTQADARMVVDIRRHTLGYISQFLRVIPRVSALDVVAQAALARGRDRDRVMADSENLLERLNVPRKLWDLPPATFSGGEQQRINIARGLIADYPLLLLDEPTASLDSENADIVATLIGERKATGTAMLGIFHDSDIRARLAERTVDVCAFTAKRTDDSV